MFAVPPEELDGVKVSLASPEVFTKSGVERVFLLTRLKFETIQKENGQAAIRVFSRQPIEESYLNFLIDVEGSNDHVIKEYSVLLDIR